MFDVGVPELILVLVVALVVFGPSKLPEVGSALGKSIREFRNATEAIQKDVETVTRLPEPEPVSTTADASHTAENPSVSTSTS